MMHKLLTIQAMITERSKPNYWGHNSPKSDTWGNASGKSFRRYPEGVVNKAGDSITPVITSKECSTEQDTEVEDNDLNGLCVKVYNKPKLKKIKNETIME